MMRVILFAAVALYSLAGAAMAADLSSRRAPPPAAYVPPPALFGWSGFYVGLDIGYAWQNARAVNWTFGPAPLVLSPNPKGVIGGGFLGYNYQLGAIVLGVEGDIEASGVSASGPFGAKLSQNIRGSARGRLGYALDRALFYATGGVTIGDVTFSAPLFPFPIVASVSATRAGWNVGGGLEFAFTPNWTGRLEYRYSDLGTASFAAPAVFVPANSVRIQDNAVRAGVAYKFNFGGGY